MRPQLLTHLVCVGPWVYSSRILLRFEETSLDLGSTANENMSLTPPHAHRGIGKSRVEVTLTSMECDSTARPHLYVCATRRVLMPAACHGPREGEKQETLHTGANSSSWQPQGSRKNTRFVWHGHELENVGTGLIFRATCSLVLANGEGFFKLSRHGLEPKR